MTETPSDDSHDQVPRSDSYVWGHGSVVQRRLEARSAGEWAWFLLPYLRPGISVLDCGCGPGSITVDLAEAVKPGEVVGIDSEENQVERARVLAQTRRLTNVRFEVANVYHLPFPDRSFDVIYANALLEHLDDPLAALRSMHGMLRPGGMVGVHSPDLTSQVYSPSSLLLDEMQSLELKLLSQAGSPTCARDLRQLLREAGFAHSKGFAHAEVDGDQISTREFASVAIEVLGQPGVSAIITQQGWASEAKLEAIRGEVRAWGERPDAYHATLWCAAVAWIDEMAEGVIL